MVRTPLVRPEQYFRRWNGFSIGRAFLVILGLTALVIFGATALAAVFATRVPDPPPGAFGELTGAALGRVIPTLFGLVVSWLVLGVVLHVAARVRGGDGSLGKAIAVAGWGMAPSAFVIVLVFVVAGASILTSTFPGDLEAAARQYQEVLSGSTAGFDVILQFGAAVWQTHIFAGGLTVGHDMEWIDAIVAGGFVAFLGFLLALV